MTRRTRLVLFAAAGVVVAGLGTGLVASYMGQTLSIIGGKGPAELAYLPRDAAGIGYADVRQMAASEWRQRAGALAPTDRMGGQLRQSLGLDIERDVDTVAFALLGTAPPPQRPLLVARGRFDEVRIEGAIVARGGRVADYKGHRIIETNAADRGAVTFAEPGLLVFGDAASVRRALDTRATGDNVTGNDELMRLMHEVDSNTAWVAGRFDALTAAQPLPGGVAAQLPAIDALAGGVRVDASVRVMMHAEAKDQAAAQNLRDVLRGLVAFGRLQAGSDPAVASVFDSLELTGSDRMVGLTMTIPPGALGALRRNAEGRQRLRAGL